MGFSTYWIYFTNDLGLAIKVEKMNNSQIDSTINALLRIAIALESINEKLEKKNES